PIGVPLQASTMSQALTAVPHEGRLTLGPALCTHAARILASVLSRSSPSQLIGGNPLEQANADGRWLAGLPDPVSTRLSKACAAAISMPAVLLPGAPACAPVESMNWESAHSPATVVNSLSVTGSTGASDKPTTPISPIAELTPPPPLPPRATM